MQKTNEYKLTRYACYATNISMAVVVNLSPLLFVTFRQMYNISYTLLGFLVLINYSTQLLIDLVFTFFSKYFNIHKTVKVTPFITIIGLLVYTFLPWLFPHMAYIWIFVGTILFSVSSGLSEVLISPVIAAIPCENAEYEMSKLHSAYAWGTALMVVTSTVFLKVFGTHNWHYLSLLWTIVPLFAFIMFLRAKLPHMEKSPQKSENKGKFNLGLALCVLCIFFGGATECTMTQWVSGFMENAIGIPKVWGDILGVATFALLLGIGRTTYSKHGKNIERVMLLGMAGATVCYIVASICLSPFVSLVACAITGLCVAMLWPGSLIYVGEKFPNASVAVYALMAAGGDMGASIGPQLVGIISDKMSMTAFATNVSQRLGVATEQVGMRCGILVSAIFPFLGVCLIVVMNKYFKKRSNSEIK